MRHDVRNGHLAPTRRVIAVLPLAVPLALTLGCATDRLTAASRVQPSASENAPTLDFHVVPALTRTSVQRSQSAHGWRLADVYQGGVSGSSSNAPYVFATYSTAGIPDKTSSTNIVQTGAGSVISLGVASGVSVRSHEQLEQAGSVTLSQDVGTLYGQASIGWAHQYTTYCASVTTSVSVLSNHWVFVNGKEYTPQSAMGDACQAPSNGDGMCPGQLEPDGSTCPPDGGPGGPGEGGTSCETFVVEVSHDGGATWTVLGYINSCD